MFITFEGSEGCGKSTQIRLLRERLEERGIPFLITREPGGTKLGESIRHLLKFAPEGAGMCAESELLLFAASRAQLVRQIIEPTLEDGRLVIADRFLDSTEVYQGFARGLEAEAVRGVNQLAVGTCRPDLTILLDMDASLAWERARRASRVEGTEDRMEAEATAFYNAVRNGYLELARREPERIVVIDAHQEEETVASEIWDCMRTRIDGFSS